MMQMENPLNSDGLDRMLPYDSVRVTRICRTPG
jgi:hypothetical protein